MTTIRTRVLVAAAVMTIGVGSAMGAALAAGGSSRSTGPDFAYGPDNPFDDASAAVHVVKTGDDQTKVTLALRAVDAPAGQRFGAHVHQQPCGASGLDAGGHYQQAGASGPLEAIEVWLDFAVGPAGNARSGATRPWLLDEAAPRSVIIHAVPTAPGTGLAGPRLACIDLDGER